MQSAFQDGKTSRNKAGERSIPSIRFIQAASLQCKKKGILASGVGIQEEKSYKPQGTKNHV
jgi:hypothetical protein